MQAFSLSWPMSSSGSSKKPWMEVDVVEILFCVLGIVV